ncbi:hypothetical protein ASC89_13350 [Devosia sp. Root413D1]|uniref:hypothetical protein n=1 Tax=Devosia sp. Root413D1 TaxID=1736531 RepID=UPI0006FA0A9A|nr:hypothetical protein [Devosia sp. Root413D1]KQW79272.1 hypothetical protein ASC89_13350 [Devosia sp. Root413D1]
MQVTRIVAICSEEPDWPIVIDAQIVADRIAPKTPFFGSWGKLGGEFSPFVLQPTGEMDFGSDYAETDRYFECNIRSREIAQGAMFTVRKPDDDNRVREFVYVIRPFDNA